MERFVSKGDDGAEETAAEREQELRLVVETIPTPVWRAAPEGNIEYVNKRALEYFGAPADEILGWGWMDKVHPDDIAFKVRTWLKNLQSEAPHDAVCRFRRADGQYRWFNVRGEPLRASDGRVLHWYGVLIDIDDRTIAEEALRASEYKLRQIIETVPGMLWVMGHDGETSRVNQRVLDYTGRRFDEFQQRGWKENLHPDDALEAETAFYRAVQTGTSHDAVQRIRRADGEHRWHQSRAEPLRDRQGRIVEWYGLSIEIDDRMKAEEAFAAVNTTCRKSSKQYQALSGQRTRPANRPNSIIAFWTTAACDWRIFSMVVGRHSCTRPTFQKLQRLSIRQFRPELPTRLCTVCVGRTANIVGAMLAVSRCATARGGSSSGTACLLILMKARRPKTGYAAAKAIWRKHKG
jgi:PAS domain S-box-containing protein